METIDRQKERTIASLCAIEKSSASPLHIRRLFEPESLHLCTIIDTTTTYAGAIGAIGGIGGIGAIGAIGAIGGIGAIGAIGAIGVIEGM